MPFCRAKCSYCGFVSMPVEDSLAERYARAVVAELGMISPLPNGECQADTVYFGGGTPSVLPVEQVGTILDTCRRRFAVAEDCEISLEANPGTVTREKLEKYRCMGINRISLGAQSFSDQELRAIGRVHTASHIYESVDLLRIAGLQNFSLDLMLGLPGQSARQWRTNLETAVGLSPSHLSIYMLELDPKVPLYAMAREGRIQMPEEDAVADWYLQAIDFLESCGYGQYEISNFALPGCECRHNVKYWRREPVLAFGVAGHSYDGSARYANVASLAAYLEKVETGQSTVDWREPVTDERSLEETIILGLRMNHGLDWSRVCKDLVPARLANCEASLREMSELGLLEWEGATVRLTRRGMLLSNEVFQRFIR